MARPTAFSSLKVNGYLLGITGGILYVNGSEVQGGGGGSVSGIPADVVRTTGDQSIYGTKTFGADTYFDGAINAGTFLATQQVFAHTNIATIQLFVDNIQQSGGGPIISLQTAQLQDNSETVTIDWDDRQLSGDWATDTNPTLPYHLINKTFFDARTGTLTGQFVRRSETGAFGGSPVTNVVRTTGDQNVQGQKTFENTFSVGLGGSVILSANTSSNTVQLSDGSVVSADTSTRVLYDVGGLDSVQWGSRLLQDYGVATSLDWNNRRLHHNGGAVTMDWQAQSMSDQYGTFSINWADRTAADSNGSTTINWNDHTLSTTNGVSLNWGTSRLYDDAGTTSLEWIDRELVNSTGYKVADWQNGVLYNGTVSETQQLNWLARQLLGQWTHPTPTTTGSIAIKSYVDSAAANAVASGVSSINALSVTTVRTTGNQTISGNKIFATQVNVNGPLYAENIAQFFSGTDVFGDFKVRINSSDATPALSVSTADRFVYMYDAAGNLLFSTEDLAVSVAGTQSLSWGNRQALDENSIISLDWAGRTLHGTAGNVSLDWGNYTVYDTGAIESINWHARQAIRNDGMLAIDWQNYILYANSTANLDWNKKILTGNWSTSTPTENLHLVTLGYMMGYVATGAGASTIPGDVVRTTGTQTIAGAKTFSSGVTFNSTVTVAGRLDGQTAHFTQISGNGVNSPLIDFNDAFMFDNNASYALGWNNRELYDLSTGISVQWQNRWLMNSAGTVVLDWSTRTLYSNWTITGATINSSTSNSGTFTSPTINGGTISGATTTNGTDNNGTFNNPTISGATTKNAAETVQTLTYATGISWNMNNGGAAFINMTGNPTILNPSNTRNGATYVLEMYHSGAARTVTWSSNFKWVSNVAPTLSPVSGRRDIAAFYCNNGVLYGNVVTGFF